MSPRVQRPVVAERARLDRLRRAILPLAPPEDHVIDPEDLAWLIAAYCKLRSRACDLAEALGLEVER